MKATRRSYCAGLALLASFATTACASRGPARLAPDRFDYSGAIAKSNDEQMLLNLVRIRYRDVPVFMAVSSVLTQYVFIGGASVAGSMGTSLGDDANNVGAGANMRFMERPTITYSPMTGPEFAEQLLTTIPTDLLFSLIQSGWPADELVLMGMERINGVHNAPFRSSPNSTLEGASEAFPRVAELFIELGARGLMEVQSAAEGEERYLVLATAADDEGRELMAEFRRVVDLDPQLNRYRITNQRIHSGPGEVTLRLRSLLALMGFLSLGVEIPDDHLERHLAEASAEPTEGRHVLPPLRIQSSNEAPLNAWVMVEYRGQWFYIDEADYQSREAFGLVVYLFMMMAPRVENAGPLLTVPTG